MAPYKYDYDDDDDMTRLLYAQKLFSRLPLLLYSEEIPGGP